MIKKIVISALFATICLTAESVLASKLKLPSGMGGVPDIGAIPCEVFNNMLVIGPLGTRRSLLTWAEGYYFAQSGKTIDELLEGAEKAGNLWDFNSLTDHLVEFCAANPDAVTSSAVIDLGEQLLGDTP